MTNSIPTGKAGGEKVTGGRRHRKRPLPTEDPAAVLATARKMFAEGSYNEAFDLYEYLIATHPGQAVPLLVEVYDNYQLLPDQQSRYHLYVSRFFDFKIKSGDKVLDIGSGHLPFPFATHLADLAVEDGSVGRAGAPFSYVDGKPVYECSVEKMPFPDKEFDFVCCSHVLEHASDPEQACRELMRVAKRGYIETPAPGKDLLLGTAKISNHRWGVQWSHGTLVFTEYTPEEIEGVPDLLLNMHCAPQTDREKAFSAIIHLKADLVNTMVYWEDSFKFEVRRAPQSASTPEATHTVIAEPAPPSILFLNVYYNGFLTHLYNDTCPNLASEPFAVQKQRLLHDLFGDSDYYTHNLAFHGWRADDLIVNAAPAQAAWARENNVAGEEFALILEQIRRFAPDVLYIQDMYAYPEEFLEVARKLGVKLIAGQIASPMAEGTPFRAYDLIFSSFPHFVERFNGAGIKSVLQPLAFEPRVLSRIPRYEYRERPIQCSFVGGISHMHKKGNELLEVLVGRTPLELWGYGAESLPADSPVRARHNGEAWGRSMYCVMASSRITVNRHIDVAENNANNLRLYEATGCGALLITDDKQNLRDMFEPGKEVAVYRSPEECASLVNYYIAHPDEAQAIAEAGQARTLRDHCYRVRMERTGAILREHIHD